MRRVKATAVLLVVVITAISAQDIFAAKTIVVWNKKPEIDSDRLEPISPFSTFLHAAISISQAMEIAEKGDTVLVRAESPYLETVVMIDGVTLVSEVFGLLPPDYTFDDVLALCQQEESPIFFPLDIISCIFKDSSLVLPFLLGLYLADNLAIDLLDSRLSL